MTIFFAVNCGRRYTKTKREYETNEINETNEKLPDFSFVSYSLFKPSIQALKLLDSI